MHTNIKVIVANGMVSLTIVIIYCKNANVTNNYEYDAISM